MELIQQCWWSHVLGKSGFDLTPPGTALTLCSLSDEMLWLNPICLCVLGLENSMARAHTLVLGKDDLESKFLYGCIYSPELSQNFTLWFQSQLGPCSSVKKKKPTKQQKNCKSILKTKKPGAFPMTFPEKEQIFCVQG